MGEFKALKNRKIANKQRGKEILIEMRVKKKGDFS